MYSLLATASIFNDIKKKGNNSKYKILQLLTFALIPIIIVISIVIYVITGLTGLMVVLLNVIVVQGILIGVFSGLGILLYLHDKKRFGNFSLKPLIKELKKLTDKNGKT